MCLHISIFFHSGTRIWSSRLDFEKKWDCYGLLWKLLPCEISIQKLLPRFSCSFTLLLNRFKQEKKLESFTRVSVDRNITRYLENRIWTGIWQSVDSSTTTGFWLIIGHVDFFRAPVELFVAISCIYGCQKWIPDKILHRNDNPIFF